MNKIKLNWSLVLSLTIQNKVMNIGKIQMELQARRDMAYGLVETISPGDVESLLTRDNSLKLQKSF